MEPIIVVNDLLVAIRYQAFSFQLKAENLALYNLGSLGNFIAGATFGGVAAGVTYAIYKNYWTSSDATVDEPELSEDENGEQNRPLDL